LGGWRTCPPGRARSLRIWPRSRRERRVLRGGRLALAGGRFLRGAAGHAEIVHVVRILDQAVVDVVTDLLARGADEVDALDGLVDPLPVEDATLQLLDADTEQLLVLPLDLPPPRLVLRKLLFRLVDTLLLVVDRGSVGLRLGPGALVTLARTCHAA